MPTGVIPVGYDLERPKRALRCLWSSTHRYQSLDLKKNLKPSHVGAIRDKSCCVNWQVKERVANHSFLLRSTSTQSRERNNSMVTYAIIANQLGKNALEHNAILDVHVSLPLSPVHTHTHTHKVWNEFFFN